MPAPDRRVTRRLTGAIVAAAMVLGSLSPPVPVAAASFQAAVDLATADGQALAVSAGLWHTCAIRADGRIACWGDQELGQIYSPTGTFSSIDAGPTHTCAIRTDGRLACWGWNERGMAQPPAGTFMAVSAGGSHTCAIRTGGSLACWGSNEQGQSAPPTGTFLAVGAGTAHTCAIKTDRTLTCWGGGTERLQLPAGEFASLSAGGASTCAIRTDGSLACWGGMDPPPSGAFKAVGLGASFACAIRADRTIACWGWSEYAATTPPDGEYVEIGAGEEHVCAIRVDGTLACWGYGEFGQLTPRPTTWIRDLPVWLVSTSVPLRWTTKPALFAVTGYDIRYRRARWNGGFEPQVRWQSGVTGTSTVFPASPGYTYCFSIRAHDASGAVSDWSDAPDGENEVCTAVALDDRSLRRSRGWTTGAGSAYYKSTYARSSTYGATLTRTGVVTQDLALVATTCRSCGWVRVYWNSMLIARVNLYSYRTLNRRLIPVAEWPTVRTGTLTIKVSTADGGKAIIDGVVIDRR